MTKKQAVDWLMDDYRAAESFRPFFQKTVDDLVGEGSIVTPALFDMIRDYINGLT